MRKLIIKGQVGFDTSKITLSDSMQAQFDLQRLLNYEYLMKRQQEKTNKVLSKQNLNNFGQGVFNGAMNLFSGFYDAIPTADDEINSTDSDISQLRGKTSQMMMQSGNPWLMAAGATVGVLDKTGAFGDATEGLGGLNDFGNAAIAYLAPGIGWMKGLETDKYKVSDALGTSSGYQGSRTFAEKALKNAGARFLFGRRKANDMISSAKLQDYQVSNIMQSANDDFTALNNMSEINGLRILNVTSGGNQMMRAARKGMSFKNISQEDIIKGIDRAKKTTSFKINVNSSEKLEQPSEEKSSDVLKFENGGQMNVIPAGALHARLHHMEDVNPDLKGQITKKGIPVVSEGEGGEIEQQAEIEREEIIFNKEVTSSLEELYAKYKEDPKAEYAIFAGKILALQIMENTDDRTGLIQRVG